MPNTQTRRRFLTTAALAGAAGLVRTPRALAAEGSLETTTDSNGESVGPETKVLVGGVFPREREVYSQRGCSHAFRGII